MMHDECDLDLDECAAPAGPSPAAPVALSNVLTAGEAAQVIHVKGFEEHRLQNTVTNSGTV